MAQRIAEAVLEQQRQCGPLTSSIQLSAAISWPIRSTISSLGEHGHATCHPAKLPFRAITAFTNQEMEQLELVLASALEWLRPRGRIVVITFKAKEEEAVRRFLRTREDRPLRSAVGL